VSTVAECQKQQLSKSWSSHAFLADRTLVEVELLAWVGIRKAFCHGCIVAEWCKIGPRLLLITNRKSHNKSFTLNDLEGQYCNRNCIGCSMSFRARRFYCEKYLQNLRPIFSLFICSVSVYITWRDDHVHGTVAIYIACQNGHMRCLLY